MTPARRHFLASVENICVAVRSGAPAPLGAAPTNAQIRRYARAAEAAAMRTTKSLVAIKGRPTDLILLRPLYADYAHLQALYAAIAREPSGSRPQAFLGQLVKEERTTIRTARALRVPGCAPHSLR